MTKRTIALLSAAALSTLATGAVAGTMGHSGGQAGATSWTVATAPVVVGGQPMMPGRTIVDNAVNSADHTTLVAAVKAAGLVGTLSGPGPFTVFAPTDAAFGELPAGTVETLVKPENKGTLTKVLTYHVVPGRIDAAALKQLIQAGNGEARLKTANGATLTASMNGPYNIAIRDGAGSVANISTYDVYQSNGVIHVVDTVLMPG